VLRVEAEEDPRVCALPFAALKGAAVPAGEFAACAAWSSADGSAGRCCNINVNPTIRSSPPTTSPVTLQWFVAGSDFLPVVVFAGSPYVVPCCACLACVCEAAGTALNDWLADAAGGFHSDWLADGPVLNDWLAAGACRMRTARSTCSVSKRVAQTTSVTLREIAPRE